MLKTIRAEAANALRTPGTSIGGREPELTRALHQLSAERGCAWGSAAPQPTSDKGLDDRGDEEEAAPKAAQETGERVAGTHGRTREGAGDGRGQPATLDGDAGAPPEQQGTAPERSEEAGTGVQKIAAATEAGAGGAGAAVASDISEQGSQAAEEAQGDGAIKDMVKKLLRTSSSVALAVARPLSIKPPPVLEVEQDPHKVKFRDAAVFGFRRMERPQHPAPSQIPSVRIFFGRRCFP